MNGYLRLEVIAKMDAPHIKISNLSKLFRLKVKEPGLIGGFTSLFTPKYREIRAVDNISLSVDQGDLVAFIGPNGAGKSTTIKMLTGIIYPTSGDVSVLGLNPARERKRLAFHIGTVFGQKPQLWYHLPPIDTYKFFSRIYEIEQPVFRKRLGDLVDAFEISDLLQTPVRKLSLGQRMRCEVVGSLLHNPKIIFLDEPTIGLDVVAKQHIRQVILHLNQVEKTTIFLTSHDPIDIESLARRTVVINDGHIIFDNLTSEFKRNYIKTKTVEIIVDAEKQNLSIPFGRVLEVDKYRIKVEVDTQVQSIGKLLSYAVENFQIRDINIHDPDMEEIISAIYGGAQ